MLTALRKLKQVFQSSSWIYYLEHTKNKKLDQSCEKVSKLDLVLESQRNIYLLVKSRYTWLKKSLTLGP